MGDVHGEGHLLIRALRLIKADNDARPDADVTLVFLGDLIDRGPDAADLVRTFAQMGRDRIVVLKGNHEAALVEAYRGDHEILSDWLPFGAAATLTGFGITIDEIDSPTPVLAAALRARIDPRLIAWLDGLPTAWECGDYYFTHAGIRPGVKLHKQVERDLLWIREPFLSSRRHHGKVIVHGHTVEPGVPPLGGNRVGVDTGAHEYGVLTALGLEEERQWLLQAMADQPEEDKSAARPGAEVSSSLGAPATGHDAPAHSIESLIASIVRPLDKPLNVALPLKSPEIALPLHSPSSRAQGLGKKGYVAGGFALFAAAIGGAVAIGSRTPPLRESSVAIPIPDFSQPPGHPTAGVAAAAPTKYLAEKNAGRRHRTNRVSGGRPKVPARVDAAFAEEPSPSLYGAALENALEEDRATTRRLNLDQLSRQRPQPSPK